MPVRVSQMTVRNFLVGAAIFCSFGLATIASAQTPYAITGGDFAGCKSLERLRKLNRYAAEGNRAAWQNELAGANIIGECTFFRQGERVFLLGETAAPGLSKVRRKGEAVQYWMNAAAVKPIRD
jgi:hypothetical protein